MHTKIQLLTPTPTSVFPPKGGNMALPHPLVLLPHPLILKFMLKNTVL